MKKLKNKNIKKIKSVASIVLAGGQGTRLQPLTTSRCKPAVSFAGKFRLIDIPISNSINSQINKIFVISQYLADSIKDHLDESYLSEVVEDCDLEILSPDEKNQNTDFFKGTADAVRKNWEHLKETDVEYFLILSGDQLYNFDFKKMIEFAKKTDADLVIASLAIKEDDAKRMGILKIDSKGKIVDFFEKPSDPKILQKFEIDPKIAEKLDQTENENLYLGSMGIYVFKKEALGKLLERNGNDFGHDLIPLKVKEGKAYSYIFNGYWEDIGTISAFYNANLALTENHVDHLDLENKKKPIYSKSSKLPNSKISGTKISKSIINPGSIIEAKEIDHSVIGVSTQINKGTVIQDSVILGNHYNHQKKIKKKSSLSSNYSIGENCVIKKAIIDEHTHIGNNVKLINQNNLLKYDGDGVFIRDGIIVVTSGTRIPDGFVL